MAPCDNFELEPPGEGTGRREGIGGKEKGSYLRVIAGLCLEIK